METSGSDIGKSAVDETKAAAGAVAQTSNALDLVIDLLEDVQKVISGGPPKMVKIRLGSRTIAEVPVALTAAAAFAAGLAAVVLTKLTIEVERDEQ